MDMCVSVATNRQQKIKFLRYNLLHKKNNLYINHWINETISGTKDIEQRKLGKLLKNLIKGDLIIASELSRFGRNMLQVMSFLSYCMENGISVWTIKDNYRLNVDLQSKIMAFAFSLSAEIERNLISQRTKEALARMKAEGKKLGRPKGSFNKTYKLTPQDQVIRQQLAQKTSVAKIAKSLKVTPKTLWRYIDLNVHDYIHPRIKPPKTECE